MENTIENAITKVRRNKWTKIIGYSLVIIMFTWILYSVAMALNYGNFQERWDANHDERVRIEKEWCEYKLAHVEDYSQQELTGCIAKVKGFQ